MSFITAIGTANPEHRFSQSQIADFMLKTMDLRNGDGRKLKAIFKSSGISFRHSVLSDYGKQRDFTFYPDDQETSFPSTQQRLHIFRQHAVSLSVQAVNHMLERHREPDLGSVTHLIVVSCTGMYAPGLDIDLVQQLKLKSSVQRTAINFMGCYAAFNALKAADAFCKADPKARVLVVCTELCSLHFQTEATEDNLLANALFGDGSAAMLVESKPSNGLQFQILNFHNDLFPEGEEAMAWTIGDLGFEMRLSSYVPAMIRKGISTLANSLLTEAGLTRNEIQYFAIHPGGKRILEAIEEELQISKNENLAAYQVLEQFGNMSSATVIFVLNQLASQIKESDHGKKLLSLAFGPGLTMESMLLQINCNHNA